MHENLDDLTRRGFIEYIFGIGTGFATAVSPVPSFAFATETVEHKDEREVFKRGSPYVETPRVDIKGFKRGHTFTREELFFVEKDLRRAFMLKEGEELSVTESYFNLWVRFERDHAYAERLIEEAKKSISHLVSFFGSKYLNRMSIVFLTPQSEGEIIITRYPPLPFYLVLGVGIELKVSCKITVGGKESLISGIPVKSRYPNLHHGLQYQYVDIKKKGRDIEFILTSSPIFYSTSSGLISLVETPPIEVLHQLVRPYTLQNANRELSALSAMPDDPMKLWYKYEGREENFVHALGILWLRSYNRIRNLGISEAELNQRFLDYENIPLYRRTNILARHITNTGVPKAIELYVKNQDELFKVLK